MGGNISSRFSSGFADNYESPVVTYKLAELGTFVWNDEESEKKLADIGLSVEERPEQVLNSQVKYTGEWSGEERHGRGT